MERGSQCTHFASTPAGILLSPLTSAQQLQPNRAGDNLSNPNAVSPPHTFPPNHPTRSSVFTITASLQNFMLLGNVLPVFYQNLNSLILTCKEYVGIQAKPRDSFQLLGTVLAPFSVHTHWHENEQHSFITQHSIQHPPRRQPRSFMEHLSKRNCFITTDLWMPLVWETESPKTVQKLPFVSPDAKLLPTARPSQHWKYSQLATANAKIRAHFQVFPVTVQRGKQSLVSNTDAQCMPQWYNQSREAHTHLIASAPPSWLPWLSQLVRP